ncbi:TonB-dependent receptor domain-containing protein [Acetonema longum]|uniref:TonB-dependent receptor plug n=1 Tax=Acetonema longum DSM 6540 TaxID=1009370 RepID=F7NPV7_9FIRM|nr:TonB-dependent receptor [Acetonema longum]EGO61948.1 TonB-dependent receptor plug [Acetonema longum DSM 6540]
MSRKHCKKRMANALKVCSFAFILHPFYTVSCYAALELVGETANYTNWGSGGPWKVKAISENEQIYTTYAIANQGKAIGQAQYNANITIDNGGLWRPLDRNGTVNVNALTMLSGSTIDFAYKYSAANSYTEANGYDPWSVATASSTARILKINNGNFEGNINFRINLGTRTYDPSTGGYVGAGETIVLNNPTVINQESYPTVHINIEYIMNKDFGAGNDSTFSWANQTAALLEGQVTGVFEISNSDTANMDKFVVAGEAINQVDGALNKYIITTELLDDGSGNEYNRSYSVYWSAKRQGYLSQGAYSAANAALSTRNLWRIEDGLFWKRGDDRRFVNRSIAKDDFDRREGVWVNTWRGKYTYDGIQDSTFGQTYSGIQVGYDKLRDRELLGGKLYTGLFFSKMTSGADFSAQNAGGADYNSGRGDLDSDGLGAYMLWVGDKGHYLDTTVRWSTIDNANTYTDSFGDSYKKDFIAQTYGIGARYGLRIDKGSGWFMEPQVGLSYGVMRSFDFRLDNGLRYQQDKMDMLLGRAGLSIGKSYGQGEHKGEAYLKLSANHDFMDGGNAMFYAMQNSANPDTAQNVLASQKVDTLAGKDTWYDVTLGSSFKLSGSSDGWLEVNRSFGGKVDTDWQINGGIAWGWGGPSKAKKSEAVNAADRSLFTDTVNTAGITAADAAAGKETTSNLPEGNAPPQQPNAANRASSNADTANADENPAVGGTNSPEAAGALQQGDFDGFTWAPLVVEADRPDWEKKLSPGTVSVIELPQYEGEHKTLGDLLQTVPGIHIDKLSGGAGHYTTVRVRGSSASQVNIYVDGVLVNTGSEQAVNLENLNIDNVERIEVYRGYIPARFAGAAMGGAINIVTKKPDKTGGKVSYGLRSFGGQKFNLETTAPMGDGSLLFAMNREEATGDFKYYKLYTTYANDSPTYPRNRWRQNNGYENNDILAKWQDDNWFVKLNYINNSTHTPQTVDSYLADLPKQYWPDSFNDEQQAIRNGTVDTEKTELSFGHRQETGNVEWGWKLGTVHQDKQTLWTKYETGNRGFVLGTNTFRNDSYSASVDGTWKMGESHLLEFLTTASKETMKVNFSADQYSDPEWKGYEHLFLPEYDMSNYYFQVQDTMKLDDRGSLAFTPLVRAQKSNIGIDVMEGEGWLYSYNLGLKKKWNDQWTTWATYGTYHRLPSWYEVFGDGVNLQSRWYRGNRGKGEASWSPEVFAEHGKNWDVSVNRNGQLFGVDNDTTLTYFNRKSENLMTTAFNPLTGATWYTNYGAGEIQGFELSNEMHWQQFDFTLSTTWQDSLITKGFKAYDNTSNAAWQGQPFPWTPEWAANARLDYRFPGDKLSVFGEYNWTDKLSWLNNAGTAAYYEPMGIFNIGMKYSFDKQFKLSTGVNDIANQGPKQLMRYLQSDHFDKGNVAYPQQGRTYYMTAEYSF